MITTRLIVLADSQPDPLAADNPQLLFVHDRAGVNIDPVAIKNGPAPLDSVPYLWDMLIGSRFDQEGLVVVYEAELQPNSEIVVKRNLLEDYGLREYPYVWSGWPIPSDGDKRMEEAPPKTTHVRGKVENFDAEVPVKRLTGRK